MADQLYRNKKTGETKHLPPAVFKSVQKNWVLVPEEKQIAPAPQKPAPQNTAPVVNPSQPETTDPEPSKEELQEQYKALSGQDADGRWSPKKLQQLIQELKEKP